METKPTYEELEAENKALRSALKSGVYHVKRIRQGFGFDWIAAWVKEASNLQISVTTKGEYRDGFDLF